MIEKSGVLILMLLSGFIGIIIGQIQTPLTKADAQVMKLGRANNAK